MSMSTYVACFRLSEYANVRHRIDAASHDEAWGEAHRLAALTGLDLVWVKPDDDPDLFLPMLVPATRAELLAGPPPTSDPGAEPIGG